MKLKRALAWLLVFFLLISPWFGDQMPLVLALNDTTQTWNFTAATASDYTYDSNLVTVDDNGAYPTGGSVGANELTNPAFASNNTSWSVAAVPPSGWVEVPGNATFSTTNFLAMKYEAKCAATSDLTTGLTSPENSSYNTYNNISDYPRSFRPRL